MKWSHNYWPFSKRHKIWLDAIILVENFRYSEEYPSCINIRDSGTTLSTEVYHIHYVGIVYHKCYAVVCRLVDDGNIMAQDRIEHAFPERFAQLLNAHEQGRAASEAIMKRRGSRKRYRWCLGSEDRAGHLKLYGASKSRREVWSRNLEVDRESVCRLGNSERKPWRIQNTKEERDIKCFVYGA